MEQPHLFWLTAIHMCEMFKFVQIFFVDVLILDSYHFGNGSFLHPYLLDHFEFFCVFLHFKSLNRVCLLIPVFRIQKLSLNIFVIDSFFAQIDQILNLTLHNISKPIDILQIERFHLYKFHQRIKLIPQRIFLRTGFQPLFQQIFKWYLWNFLYGDYLSVPMLFYVVGHFWYSWLQHLWILLFETVDKLGHFLVVEGFDNSFEILLQCYFCLLFCYLSLVAAEKINLFEIDQIYEVKRQRNKKSTLLAQLLMVNNFVVLRLWKFKVMPLILKSNLFVANIERSLIDSPAHSFIGYRVLAQITDMSGLVIVNTFLVEDNRSHTICNCIVYFAICTFGIRYILAEPLNQNLLVVSGKRRVLRYIH